MVDLRLQEKGKWKERNKMWKQIKRKERKVQEKKKRTGTGLLKKDETLDTASNGIQNLKCLIATVNLVSLFAKSSRSK